MAEIKIVYKELEDLSDHARKVAEKCDDYIEELNTKVTNKLSTLPSSPLASSATHIYNTNTYVNAKKNALASKKENYKAFADSVDTLLENTKAADNAVGTQVNTSKKNFLKEHPNLEGDGWAAFFAAISTEVPVLGWIVDRIQTKFENARDLVNTIRRWYDVSGGKKVVDTILAIGGVVLAVVGAVVAVCALLEAATVGAIIFAILGVVGAVIGVINALTDLGTQIRANMSKDPAWSNYYGNQNNLATVLRKHTIRTGNTWLNKFLNRTSLKVATSLEITETICAVAGIFEGVGKLFTSSGVKALCSNEVKVKNLAGEETTILKLDFSKVKTTFFTKEGWSDVLKTVKTNKKVIIWGNKDGFKSAISKDFTDALAVMKKNSIDSISDIKNLGSGIKRVYSIGVNGGKLGQTIYSGTFYGGNFKKDFAYGVKQTTDILGVSGIIKTITSSINSGYKINSYASNW